VFTAQGLLASSLPATPSFAQKVLQSFTSLAAHKIVTLGSVNGNDTSYFMMAFPLRDSPRDSYDETVPRAGVAFGVSRTEIDDAQHKTLIGAVVPAVLFTVIVGLLSLALANQIARPIAAMAEQFRRISASGNLSLRVPVEADNEIGDMARSFNGMQDRVEQLHDRVVGAEERMRKELQMASSVQEMLFQQLMPHNRFTEVAAYTTTLVETSGDWYAVFDDPVAKRTIFVIADATGHGASAALLTAVTHGFFWTMWTAKQGGDAALSRIAPSQILSMLNSVVINSAHGAITASCFVGVLHHGTRKIVYSSAGHIPPIVTRWENGEMKANILSSSPSSSIGHTEKTTYEDYTVDLPPDALLLIYSDGLTEVESPTGQQWGVRKLINVLRGCELDTVESVRQKVLDSVMSFAKGKDLQDDMTYLTVRIR
jgi:serine phosphatase RsbU (regulator of sigma subunit)